MSSAVVRRYARALFEATPADARDAVASDLGQIGEVLADPAARLAVTDPEVSSEVRRKAVQAMTSGAHDVVGKFAEVLMERRRESVLLDIAAPYHELVLASRGEVEGLLETAAPLNAGQVEELQAMATRLSGHKVRLKVVDNPDLLGGVRMRVGNQLFDGSVATAIEDLERQLMDAPIAGA